MKRRLARDVGDRVALRFYRANLARLLRALTRDRRFHTVLAVTPDRVARALAGAACRSWPRVAATLGTACTAPAHGIAAGWRSSGPTSRS